MTEELWDTEIAKLMLMVMSWIVLEVSNAQQQLLTPTSGGDGGMGEGPERKCILTPFSLRNDS